MSDELRYRGGLLIATLVFFVSSSVGLGKDLSVHIDFPGGSALVESIDQEKRSIRLMPSDHPKQGWRCWWYFRLEGLSSGETFTIDVGEAPWATPDQAAVSIDGRKTWRHTAVGKRYEKRIVYEYTAKNDEPHWFAWGPPFVLADAQQLIQESAKKSGGWGYTFHSDQIPSGSRSTIDPYSGG